jgi:ligand-binding SRPBCC domain-containing protein
MADFQESVVLPRNRETSFRFLRQPDNFLKLFPEDVTRNLDVKLPDTLSKGAILEFNIRVMGNHFHIVHEIIDVAENDRIVAQQVKGPFKLWIHQQLFTDAPQNETLLTNVIQFEPPGGLMGFIVTRKLITEQLTEWIGHGHELLRESLAKTPS